jgi:hypothetical protein
MRKSHLILLALTSVAISMAGCDKINFFKSNKSSPKQSSQIRGTVIAKVGAVSITLEELNREIDAYNTSVDISNLSDEDKKLNKVDTSDKKLKYLKDILVRRMVFYQAALDRGLDRKDDISEMLERTKAAILAQEMENDIIKNIDVSPTEIDEAYKTIKEQLKEAETRKVREIAVQTKEEANQILVELLQGADFDTIARARSIAKSKDAGGDLGLLKKDQAAKSRSVIFLETAFSPALR